jgi:hypothetical protein
LSAWKLFILSYLFSLSAWKLFIFFYFEHVKALIAANANVVIVTIASGTFTSSVVSCTLITIEDIAIIAATVTVVAASCDVAISNTNFIIIVEGDR